jgi:hypothetical protein
MVSNAGGPTIASDGVDAASSGGDTNQKVCDGVDATVMQINRA